MYRVDFKLVFQIGYKCFICFTLVLHIFILSQIGSKLLNIYIYMYNHTSLVSILNDANSELHVGFNESFF